MFTSRPIGTTLGRVERIIHDPHHASERFDSEFMLNLQCQACGKLGASPRKHIRAAIQEHAEQCEKRGQVDAVHVRVLYPKQ